MIRLSRRGFVASVAAVPLLGAGSGAATSAGPILLYDPTLASGRAFSQRAAELDLESLPLEGDRVAMLRTLFQQREPEAFWGLSRHADQLLIGEIARERGYRASFAVQHFASAPARTKCQAGMRGVGVVAAMSGAQWPTAFAEMAAGINPICDHSRQRHSTDGAMSWVLARDQSDLRQHRPFSV